MLREQLLRRLSERSEWDILIIGGGATGLGAGVEAATRGYSTLLAEQHDFCKGTSSRSTKLIHGGVRYLEQGNITLVVDALRERGRLVQNAPHIVRKLPLIVPLYHWWEGPYYGLGLKLYDLLAGRLSLGRSKILSPTEVLEKVPTLRQEGLKGGVLFFDAQFDDVRLGLALARTASLKGALLLNYMRMEALLKEEGKTCGAILRDVFTDGVFEVKARIVLNCTGVFSDQVRTVDKEGAEGIIAPSQGSHLVFDRDLLSGEYGVLIPKTDDRRVLFALPWLGKVIAGTTDLPVKTVSIEPKPSRGEIDFILAHIQRYFSIPIGRQQIRSAFAGLRPLIRDQRAGSTASLSRDHMLLVSDSGLISVLGGKWTSYRKMGEDAVDRAAREAGLQAVPSRTATLPIRAPDGLVANGSLAGYGVERSHLLRAIERDPSLGERIHESFPYRKAEVAWAVQEEWAVTLEDVLARRTRILLLDVRAARQAAPVVAHLMSRELGKDKNWEREQVTQFEALSEGYLP